jgi:hypothetical protein
MSTRVPKPAQTPVVGIVPELAPEPAPEAEPEAVEPEPPEPEPEVTRPEPPEPVVAEPEVTRPEPPEPVLADPVELPEPTDAVPVPPHPATAAIQATSDNGDIAFANATHFELCMWIDLLSERHEVKENRGQRTQFTIRGRTLLLSARRGPTAQKAPPVSTKIPKQGAHESAVHIDIELA